MSEVVQARAVVAPPWVFVPGPMRGVWTRSDLSLLVACPECEAKPFELCARSNTRPLRRTGATHWKRRRAFREDEGLAWVPKASLCPVVKVKPTGAAAGSKPGNAAPNKVPAKEGERDAT